MFEKRTLLALIVVGIILLLLPQYYKLISPPRPPGQETVAPVDTTAKQPDTVAAIPKPTEIAHEQVPVETTRVSPSVAETGPDSAALVNEYVSVETPLFRLRFASNGMVSYYALKAYTMENGDPVVLHDPATANSPVVGAVDFDLGPRNVQSLADLRFHASKTLLDLSSQPDSVIFERHDAEGRDLWVTYIFYPDRYGFDVRLKTQGWPTTETGEFKTRWVGGVPFTEPDSLQDVRYSGSYAKVGDEIEKMSLGSDKTKDFTATGETFFVAARSKYFMAALVPAEPAAGVDLHGYSDTPKEGPLYYNCTLHEPWKAAAGGFWTVYWGPMRFEELKAVGAGLEETMNWGWAIIRPFSRLTLWALTAMHTILPNYGFVIIIFSIMVKVVLWPLTRKSQISMKKMSALQPEMQRIRDEHKKNPQAANAEIMKLYKERGVNPAAGCIPLLIQMPILYGLFIIFSSTIEFRHAPFIWWIQDLSRPDYVAHLPFSIPLYGAYVAILPLIMGISQFFMSKRTVTDPNQKMMLYVMPVFMLMIFNRFPSGLTLYYTLFNLLAIVEQRLIKLPDFGSVEVVEVKKKK
jgi:YidC/Oxa1 family membrane protein insertase